MRKKLILSLIAVVIMTASAVCTAAAADAVFTLDGAVTDVLSAGSLTAFVEMDCTRSTTAYVFTAVYAGNELAGADIQKKVLSTGTNKFSSSPVIADSDASCAKVMVLDASNLKPLTEAMCITAEKTPAILSSSVTIAGKTSAALIDPEQKTVTFNVMTTTNRDGTLINHASTPTAEEFDAALVSLAPVFTCTDGSYVEGSGSAKDFSSPNAYNLVKPDGTKEAYTVIIERTTGLRSVNLAASSMYLVNPSTSYGTDATRHGAPGPAGTVFGGGQWRLRGFSYKQSDGSYVTESDSYVRSDDSPGYLQINSKKSVSIIKDKAGDFSLYSTNGGSTGIVKKSETNFSFSVDSISGTGFDTVFGGSDLIMRVAPFADNYYAVYFGSENALSSAAYIIESGTKYTVRAVWTKLDSGLAKGELYINGGFADSCTISQSGAVDLRTEHVSFAPSSDTLCSVQLYSWDVSYVPRPVPEAVTSGLKEFDSQFDGALVWLANMYDPETGGFYMTMSGKEDPDMQPAIEMTGWGISMIKSYTDLWDTMPDSIREGFVNFFNSRQDPDTGYFIDTQGIPESTREISRNQSAARNALNHLGAQSFYPHPYDTQTASAASLMTVSEASSSDDMIPAYMESVESYIEWIESWNWDTGSWTAGDQTGNSVNYVRIMDTKHQEETGTSETPYQDALFNWLDNRQDPETGFWSGKNVDFNGASGVFKVGAIYSSFGKQMNYPDEIIESIITAYKTDTQSSPYFVRNPLSVFRQIGNYSPEYKEKVLTAVEDNIDLIVSASKRFLCPDGAFSASYQKSMLSFGGVTGSHQLYEGDIDATMMIYVARAEIYSLFGISAPKFTLDGFWDMLLGTVETPVPYADPEEVEKYDEFCADFEQYSIGTTLTGTEFGGSSIASSLTARIADSGDTERGNALLLSYEGTSSSGPGFRFKPVTVKYNPGTQVTYSFDIYCKSAAASNNLYISMGSELAYALTLGGNGTQKLNNRIYTDKLSKYPLTTISAGSWHNIKVVYDHTEANCAKVYVDNKLISENNLFYGCEDGETAAKAATRFLSFVFYRASDSEFMIDNIEILKTNS